MDHDVAVLDVRQQKVVPDPLQIRRPLARDRDTGADPGMHHQIVTELQRQWKTAQVVCVIGRDDLPRCLP